MTTRHPLSFQQQWLWNLCEAKSDWVCSVVYPFSLHGTLDLYALKHSLEQVIRRHTSLRTKFLFAGGVLEQQVDEVSALDLKPLLVPGDSPLQIEAEARSYVDQLSALKTQVTCDPLLHVRLLKLSDREHWLVLAIHRMIADCYAVDVLLKDLWMFYAEYVQGKPLSLCADPMQYTDYTQWQRKACARWPEGYEDYWQELLSGAERLNWPISNPSEQSTRGALGKMSTWFGSELSVELREFARRSRTLAANVMLAVFLAVVWRWCRQGDFVMSVNVAGRQAQHKSVVGFFPHILLLRFALDGNETLAELLVRTANEFFRALSHADFGRAATRRRELLSGAFFQWITWHPDEEPSLPAAGERELKVKRVVMREFGEGLTAIPAGMVDVEVTFFDTAEGIYASGVYRTDLFAQRVMDRFMEDLRMTAAQVVRNPNVRITDFATDSNQVANATIRPTTETVTATREPKGSSACLREDMQDL